MAKKKQEKSIEKIVFRNIEELIPAEYNPRQLTEKQAEDLKASIQRFGLIDPIIINKHPERENIIIGGHMRMRMAKQLGFKEVPTVELNLSIDQEKELNIRLNKNSGEWDWDALANEFENSDLEEWGFDGHHFKHEEFEEEQPPIDEDINKKKKIVLEYTDEEYEKVKEALEKMVGTPEEIIWGLLKLK